MTTKVKGSSIDFSSTTKMTSLLDLGPVNSDITTLLQAALNAGTAILIPIGTWNSGPLTIPDNSVIIGFGIRSVLRLRDAGNGMLLTVGNNCLLQDFIVDGNKLNQVGTNLHTVNLNGSVRSKVKRVGSFNAKGSGFFIAGPNSDIDLEYCVATGYTESGINVTQTTDLTITSPNIYNSDATATGDAIRLISTGNFINGVSVLSPKIKGITGRGIALVGSGSKNVADVLIADARILSCTNHGIFMNLTDRNVIHSAVVKVSGGDGIRLEGDVQNTRVMNSLLVANTGGALREVANGASPNLNSFIYNTAIGNGSGIAKLGAGSVIV